MDVHQSMKARTIDSLTTKDGGFLLSVQLLMKLSWYDERMTKKMPKTASERGQLYLYANTPERKSLLSDVRERYPAAKSLSGAVFQALDDWKKYAETGSLVRPFVGSLSSLLMTATIYLAKQDPERRDKVYQALLRYQCGRLMSHIAQHHQKLLGRQLPGEQTLAF